MPPPLLRLLVSLLFLPAILSAKPNRRIVRGRPHRSSSAPPTALLLIPNSPSSYHPCTATLISRLYLLTAAHCFNSSIPSKTLVFISSTTAYPFLTIPTTPISQVFIHSLYDSNVTEDLRHDLALIRLAENYTGPAVPVRIVSPPSILSLARAYGYGEKENGKIDVLRRADLVVRSFHQCARNERPAIRKFLRINHQLCATGPGWPHQPTADTCYGDSGGGLFRNENGWQQFAVTSFGDGECGGVGVSGWYVRLDYYRKSINTVLNVDNPYAGGFKVVNSK